MLTLHLLILAYWYSHRQSPAYGLTPVGLA